MLNDPLNIIENAIYDKLNGMTISYQGKSYTINVYKIVPSAGTPYIHLIGGGFGEVGAKTYNLYNIEHEFAIVASEKGMARAILGKLMNMWPINERLELNGAQHIINELISTSEVREIIDGKEFNSTNVKLKSVIK